MPTSTTRSTRARRPVVVGVVVGAVLIVLAGVVAVLVSRPDGQRATAAAPRPVPPVASVTPAPSTTAAAPPDVPHDVVAAAAPSRFTLSGPAFTIRARVCGMANIRPLDPPGEQHHTVCWVKDGFGVAPGSRSATTYVLGHAWAPDPLEVLNAASSLATRDVLRAHAVRYDGIPVRPAPSLLGYHLTLTTAQGRLTYTVRKAYGVRKSQTGLIRSVMDEKIARRVVLITCAERGGRDYDDNIVLEAFLTSSQRTASRA